MRRVIAEIGAVGFGLFATILTAVIFVAAANNLLRLAFLLPFFLFHWFGRAWMFQVLEVKQEKRVRKV